MRMPQKFYRFFHVALCDQLTDMGGADADAINGLLRDNNAGNTQFCAGLLQEGSIAFPSVAKAEIRTADQTGCVQILR